MAKNFNIRRSIANYAVNIRDGSERLGCVLIQRHFADIEAVRVLMNNLSDMLLTNIQAAVDRAEMTIIVGQTLLDIFKNLRKKKEAEIQLTTKDEVAAVMEQQKQRRKQRLDQQMAIPTAWNLPANDNMN